MKKAIQHFTKLLECKQFIVTGSYALHLLGLWNNPSDLDIVLVNPTEGSIEILKKLREGEPNPDYPSRDDQYRVKYEDIHVDFFIKKSTQKVITLFEGAENPKLMMHVAMPEDIIKAKKSYPGLKQLLQRKIIAEKFYVAREETTWLNTQQRKIKVNSETFDDIEIKIEPVKKK